MATTCSPNRGTRACLSADLNTPLLDMLSDVSAKHVATAATSFFLSVRPPVCLSVCLSAWNNSTSIRWICSENCVGIQFVKIFSDILDMCRSQWPRSLRRGSTSVRLLGLWVRILERHFRLRHHDMARPRAADRDVLQICGFLQIYWSIFISVFNQLDAQNLFHNKFYFMPLHVSSTCSHHQEVKIALHSLWYHHLVHETATYRCDDTRCCAMQFWPPDDEHMCSKHVEAWNTTYREKNFVHQVG